MEITISTTRQITCDQFIDVLQRSTLSERRPIEDRSCMQAMLEHGNLLATAWDGDLLVGVSRSLTDFHYACYLSDLAVDAKYQKSGIGKKLIDATQQRLGTHCKIILLAAPAAREYYPKIGLTRHDSAWTLAREQKLR
jgi:GNAT superfamily N-acetyltransferase